MYQPFSIANDHPPKAGLTISTLLLGGEATSVTAFSLGSGTDISPEAYDHPILYIDISGSRAFQVVEARQERHTGAGEFLWIAPGALCGVKTRDGFVYTEIISRRARTSVLPRMACTV